MNNRLGKPRNLSGPLGFVGLPGPTINMIAIMITRLSQITPVSTSSGSLQSSLARSTGQRNVLDWARTIRANPDAHALDGQAVDVVGFVYRDAQFADNQFMVTRLTIVCCVADASAIGLVVQTADAKKYEPDSWVRVTGKFAAGVLDDKAMPVVSADAITPVEPPQQPYLFP